MCSVKRRVISLDSCGSLSLLFLILGIEKLERKTIEVVGDGCEIHSKRYGDNSSLRSLPHWSTPIVAIIESENVFV